MNFATRMRARRTISKLFGHAEPCTSRSIIPSCRYIDPTASLAIPSCDTLCPHSRCSVAFTRLSRRWPSSSVAQQLADVLLPSRFQATSQSLHVLFSFSSFPSSLPTCCRDLHRPTALNGHALKARNSHALSRSGSGEEALDYSLSRSNHNGDLPLCPAMAIDAPAAGAGYEAT